jgi:hypothetical protein
MTAMTGEVRSGDKKILLQEEQEIRRNLRKDLRPPDSPDLLSSCKK